MIEPQQRRHMVPLNIQRECERLARNFRLGVLGAFVVGWGFNSGFCSPGTNALLADQPAVFDIQSPELTESSGLAASNRVAGYFWTHNDSGGEPKLFAIDETGTLTGSVVLDGAKAIDWEDIASFTDGASKRLVIADIGDNQAIRNEVTLYLMDEPDPLQDGQTALYREIRVRYPDGPRDCEAIGVDLRHRQILMVGKSFLPLAPVYSMPLPSQLFSAETMVQPVVLERVGTIAAPLITAMEVDPRCGDLFLVNYFQCFRFKVDKDDAPGAWIKKVPSLMELPKLKQIEAVAIDANGDVWVTSEGSPGKLARVEMSDEKVPQVAK